MKTTFNYRLTAAPTPKEPSFPYLVRVKSAGAIWLITGEGVVGNCRAAIFMHGGTGAHALGQPGQVNFEGWGNLDFLKPGEQVILEND